MSENTEASAVADLTRLASAAVAITPGTLLHTVTGQGDIRVKDTQEYAERPRRKTGTAEPHDAAAFIAYLSKHGLPETEVWADLANQQLVAVINAHEGIDSALVDGQPGWGDHRAQLVLRKTPAWKAWASHDKEFMSQTTFAEHIEERLPDFLTPTGAEMLELAQTFKANTKVDFESSRRLKSGETTLVYREQTAATAGPKGDIVIPDGFTLAVEPFDGAGGYKLNARFRYRITEDKTLRLGYVLERPEDVLRLAFDDIVTAVDGAIAGSIWHGTP